MFRRGNKIWAQVWVRKIMNSYSHSNNIFPETH